jgi:hypothetical protein
MPRIASMMVASMALAGCALPSAWADPVDAGADALTLDARGETGTDAGSDLAEVSTGDGGGAADAVGAAVDVTDAAVADAVSPEPEVTVTTTAPVELPRRVVDYTLRATLDPVTHVVQGEGTVRWTNTSRVPARELWFHLYLNAFRGADTLFMRSWGERETPPTQWGGVEISALRLEDGTDLLPRASHPADPPGDETQLRVALPREVPPGAAVTLTLRWRSTLPSLIARTGFHGRFHMVAQWFPKLAVLEPDGRWASFPFHAHTEFYADFGRYDVTLDVPRGWTVGASGERAGAVTPRGDRDVHRYLAARVHDFAWTTWDAWRVRDAQAGGLALRVLHAPGAEGDAQRVVELTEGMVPAFARRFGAYPYPNLTVVLPPRGAEEAGGMEYPTLITTVGAWWAPRRLRVLEYVTVHEFGHQYFYGLFASNENRWPFLDEGLCEYATSRVMQDLYGPEGNLWDIPALAPRMGPFAQSAASSAAITAPVPVTTAAPDFATYGRYGSHVYARTTSVLRTAERTVGPWRFEAAMRAYAEAARFRHPTPDTLFDVLGPALGDDTTSAWLRAALESPAQLNYRVSLVESTRSADGTHRGRVIVDRAGGPALPVDIALENTRGERTWTRWDAREGTVVIPYAGPAALRAAWVDPEGRVALDGNRLDNARVAAGEARSSMPLVARVAWWLGLVLDTVGP